MGKHGDFESNYDIEIINTVPICIELEYEKTVQVDLSLIRHGQEPVKLETNTTTTTEEIQEYIEIKKVEEYVATGGEVCVTADVFSESCIDKGKTPKLKKGEDKIKGGENS